MNINRYLIIYLYTLPLKWIWNFIEMSVMDNQFVPCINVISSIIIFRKKVNFPFNVIYNTINVLECQLCTWMVWECLCVKTYVRDTSLNLFHETILPTYFYLASLIVNIFDSDMGFILFWYFYSLDTQATNLKNK